LIVYQFAAAGVFGYVLSGRRGREIAAFLLLLFAMSMVLVIEIDRPVTGQINESQDAMIQLQATLREQRHKCMPSSTRGLRHPDVKVSMSCSGAVSGVNGDKLPRIGRLRATYRDSERRKGGNEKDHHRRPGGGSACHSRRH
jgi:hypothetical protein